MSSAAQPRGNYRESDWTSRSRGSTRSTEPTHQIRQSRDRVADCVVEAVRLISCSFKSPLRVDRRSHGPVCFVGGLRVGAHHHRAVVDLLPVSARSIQRRPVRVERL
jgi:hypothetical protein